MPGLYNYTLHRLCGKNGVEGVFATAGSKGLSSQLGSGFRAYGWMVSSRVALLYSGSE